LIVNKINRSAIVPYSQEQMFRLVTDISSYPEFLPWCSEAEIIDSDQSETTAKLFIRFKGVRQSFTTRNINRRPDRIIMQLVDGPFSHMGGEWQFLMLSDTA
jgi:ribosome-associated toxin RatA of RatAB toxin-antitoxin module